MFEDIRRGTVLAALWTAGVFAPGARAEAPAIQGLPEGAQVIEQVAIEGTQRELVLWMIQPTKNPREGDEGYTCPEYTRGHHWTGKTRVSLVSGGKITSTVEIQPDEGEDSFDVPYRLEAGHYYMVPDTEDGKEGAARVLNLVDLTGDGKSHEVMFYDSFACVDPTVSIIGYDPARDAVIQYMVEWREGKDVTPVTSSWTSGVFSRKPVSPGTWKHEVDERGRGGALCRYEASFRGGVFRVDAACEPGDE